MEPNHEIYQRLIEPIEERMIAIVTRIMQDHHDAMDVFQEVLAVVWKKLRTIETLRPWFKDTFGISFTQETRPVEVFVIKKE